MHVPAKHDPSAPLKKDIAIRIAVEGEMQAMRFVRSCVCLGAIIHESLTDDAETSGRILKATQMFGMLREEMLAS
jgi:hypothetical protein